MEHDSSSRSGYHEPKPGRTGHADDEEDWDNSENTPGKPYSVNLIWAQARDTHGRDGAIGFEGSMPWHLSEDLRRFKELTISHPVIMGRKTWESLQERYRPLSNRDNIVVSRQPDYRAAGATVVGDFEAAMDLARQESIPDDGMDRTEIWVIGGAQLFDDVISQADKAYVTQIDAQVAADTYAPDIQDLVDSGRWFIADSGAWQTPRKADGVVRRFRFVNYQKAN
ncbi:dihydrofolate reductase [Bifidobacterium crudilactis]|jgi:dihydrofolate reductase|uniref:dihydrofolate reductase n=1 Tax=Bifidobacterium crudilactis TaxID=327277 RepID=A0A971ID17_9BIFI|nr:dihydrofolate reductase [Bifidobacterium crudilactis]MCI1644128.1 dihydrofolate reductase [Bifidobacterium crudilactis]MCI1664150.1 dihydrofolate reductase [Bifidobacterium crudilactis]MCI1868309.1 dihydrofolate reductase [Bifidobacterium crudilactis]MCI1889164.1 dihydrofolate reductase [Bifidobacterium crudilactis]MDN5972742.1 dihydrofolate reductase [Bifidobacterium crudilactis]